MVSTWGASEVAVVTWSWCHSRTHSFIYCGGSWEGRRFYSHMQLVKTLPAWSGLHPGDLDTPSGPICFPSPHFISNCFIILFTSLFSFTLYLKETTIISNLLVSRGQEPKIQTCVPHRWCISVKCVVWLLPAVFECVFLLDKWIGFFCTHGALHRSVVFKGQQIKDGQLHSDLMVAHQVLWLFPEYGINRQNATLEPFLHRKDFCIPVRKDPRTLCFVFRPDGVTLFAPSFSLIIVTQVYFDWFNLEVTPIFSQAAHYF